MIDYVSTISNTKVKFLDPRNADIKIEDMFYQLARIPRWTCSTRKSYTVGQHSLLVAEQMTGKYALIGLLHDCAEYVFNDLSSPIVAQCPDYKRLRDNFQAEIFRRFLPESMKLNAEAAIHEMHTVDRNMAKTEYIYLKLGDATHLPGTVLNNVYFEKSKPKRTELELHKMYHHYWRLADV